VVHCADFEYTYHSFARSGFGTGQMAGCDHTLVG
jgi:hypothetical protein